MAPVHLKVFRDSILLQAKSTCSHDQQTPCINSGLLFYIQKELT